MLTDKKILVTGGTGSLGKVLIKRLLSGELGVPKKIIVFSRDEAKQHLMRIEYLNKKDPTDEIIYNNSKRVLQFIIGDVRDPHSLNSALKEVDVVFNAAALKQVPSCEYFPFEAVQTNIMGPQNIVNAIKELDLPIETVVGISTDKACKPVNVMGMTKAIQERIFIQANMKCQSTRFICVRYGNVLASRGSVIPLFHEQIISGGPLTITTSDMTRFLLSLNQAVDTIFSAIKYANRGETYVPIVPSANIMGIAKVLIGKRDIKTVITGTRPGEKIHEILVSEEEVPRTIKRGDYYVILPLLPELRNCVIKEKILDCEYSSADNLMNLEELQKILSDYDLLLNDIKEDTEELIR